MGVAKLSAGGDPSTRPQYDRKGQLPEVSGSGVLAVIGTLVAPTAVVAGLLYYFGWVRTEAIFSYFGVDIRLIDYSPTDYILRSSNVLFNAVIRLAFVALLLVGVHRFLIIRALHLPGRSRSRAAVQWFVIIGEVAGVVLAAVVLAAVVFPAGVGSRLGLLVPLFFIVSVALFGYVAHLWSTYPQAFAIAPQMAPVATGVDRDVERDEHHPSTSGSANSHQEEVASERRRGKDILGVLVRVYDASAPPRAASPSRLWSFLLISFALVGILWAVSLYAYQDGQAYATRVGADLPNQSAVVLYATQRLAVDGPGITAAEIVQPGSRYHYQYSGLRLLTRSAQEYLLLPRYWQRGRDRVFIIRNDDSIRIDVFAR